MQRKPDEAKRIGREIIEKLLHTETDDNTFPLFELQEAYAIIGEEITYDEAGKLYCESMGEIITFNAIVLKIFGFWAKNFQ